MSAGVPIENVSFGFVGDSGKKLKHALHVGAFRTAFMYELTWNHTTLHALNVDRDVTYLQARAAAHPWIHRSASDR
jgi:hypothetical protein